MLELKMVEQRCRSELKKEQEEVVVLK